MIDKSIRYKYAWGGPGGKSPGTSASGDSRNGGGGGPPGGGDRQMTYSAPSPSPDRQDRARQQAAAEQAAAKQRAAEQRAEANRVAKQAAEGKVDVGFQEALKKTADARQREEEFLDTGDIDVLTDLTGFDTAPKVDVKDIMGEVTDPDSGSYDKLTEVLDSPDVDEGFKRYVRQVQQPIAPETGPGIGTTLKNIALGVLAPQLLAGTSLAKPYNLYRQYQTAKRYIPKIGDIETALRSNIRTPKNLLTKKSDDLLGTKDWQGEQKRKKTFHEGKGDGEATIAKQVAGGENVIAKHINQFAGTEVEGQISSLVQNDLNKALRHYADMTSRIEKGYSPDRREMDVYKLLEHYLNRAAPKPQGAAYGGRIDKALGGRSRDI